MDKIADVVHISRTSLSHYLQGESSILNIKLQDKQRITSEVLGVEVLEIAHYINEIDINHPQFEAIYSDSKTLNKYILQK